MFFPNTWVAKATMPKLIDHMFRLKKSLRSSRESLVL
jgi:hypothetical protein